MINDLHTDGTTIKYVDDTMMFHVSKSTHDNSLQAAVTTANSWSKMNSMKINVSKTKEMKICFSKSKITVDREKIGSMSSLSLASNSMST